MKTAHGASRGTRGDRRRGSRRASQGTAWEVASWHVCSRHGATKGFVGLARLRRLYAVASPTLTEAARSQGEQSEAKVVGRAASVVRGRHVPGNAGRLAVGSGEGQIVLPRRLGRWRAHKYEELTLYRLKRVHAQLWPHIFPNAPKPRPQDEQRCHTGQHRRRCRQRVHAARRVIGRAKPPRHRIATRHDGWPACGQHDLSVGKDGHSLVEENRASALATPPPLSRAMVQLCRRDRTVFRVVLAEGREPSARGNHKFFYSSMFQLRRRGRRMCCRRSRPRPRAAVQRMRVGQLALWPSAATHWAH